MIDSRTKNEDWLTISETAKKCKVTRQAVYVAIKKKRLNAKLVNRVWVMHVTDVDLYRESRYDRVNSKINGEPIFDIARGYLSVNHASKLFGTNTQHIYYLLRTGQLHASKKGSAWVVNFDEVKRLFQEKNGLVENKSQMTFA